VLRTFWRDRFGQVLVGLLLATFTFCVLDLTQIDTSRRPRHRSRWPGLLLARALDPRHRGVPEPAHPHQYVGPDRESIADETLLLVAGAAYATASGTIGTRWSRPTCQAGDPVVVAVGPDGWVQQISRACGGRAVPPARSCGWRRGSAAYLVGGEPLASVWPPGPGDSAAEAGTSGEAVIVGNARTMQQDIDFGLRQLNDIALRALSRR
jgi:hypothetical protein